MTFTRPSGNVVRFANTCTNKHARTYTGILCVGAYIISHSWLLYPDGRHPPTYTLTFGKMPTHTMAFWGNVCIRTHTNNHLEMNESTKIKPTVLRTTLYKYKHTYTIHTHTHAHVQPSCEKIKKKKKQQIEKNENGKTNQKQKQIFGGAEQKFKVYVLEKINFLLIFSCLVKIIGFFYLKFSLEL